MGSTHIIDFSYGIKLALGRARRWFDND